MTMVLAIAFLVLLDCGIKQPLAWIDVTFISIDNGFGCAAFVVAQALPGSKPATAEQIEWMSIFIRGGVGATTARNVLLVIGLLGRRKSSAAKA